MAKASVKTRFQLCKLQSLLWASWGDEFVVFNEASGQTHLLDPIKAFILDALMDGPLDAISVAPLLSEALVVTGEINLQELTDAALEQLAKSQLVEAIPS